MPRTITIDTLAVQRLVLLKDAAGELQIYAEYSLANGSTLVQLKQESVQAKLSGTRRAAALSLFDAVAGDLRSLELA